MNWTNARRHRKRSTKNTVLHCINHPPTYWWVYALMTSKTVHVYFNTLSFMLRTCSVRKQKDITSAKAVDLTAFREAFFGLPRQSLERYF